MYVNAKVEHVVIVQSKVPHDDSYVVPTTVDINGLILTPYVTGLVKESQRKYELLHFGFVAQWQPFRVIILSRQI
jgi:hypothetical protein